MPVSTFYVSTLRIRSVATWHDRHDGGYRNVPGIVTKSRIPEHAPVFVGPNHFVRRTLLFLRRNRDAASGTGGGYR
jgi:hypothetical protein